MSVPTPEPAPPLHSPQRESLLSAAARASRLLLEATDVMAVMPRVLRELGEAAQVDRTALATVETDADGARWLVVKSEWVAPSMARACTHTERVAWDDRRHERSCRQLRSGQPVFVRQGDPDELRNATIVVGATKSSIIVPFLVDGEYLGAVGFDDCRRMREFEPAIVSALEIAASVIGAALHRERLAEAVRRERELASELRVAQLAKANAALRSNLEWLAAAPDPKRFYEHMLLATVREFDAAAGTLVMLSICNQEWRVIAHARAGAIETPSIPVVVPSDTAAFAELESMGRELVHRRLEQMEESSGPGIYDYHRRLGHQGAHALPLVFGERNVGVLVLSFGHAEPLGHERSEMLVAYGQQMTLAIAFKRLGMSARNAAVLAERNRIGQEIHDGLAQAFVGILMQLGAAEGLANGSPLAPVLARMRDMARDGLAEARRSVLALRPAERRARGLEFALRQLAERSTVAGGARCVFEGGGEETGLAPEHEHELLRIAQEAVSNAVRHARPREVRIALVVSAQMLQLSVTDDGCGMQEPSELDAQQGFGLTNMRERAQAIGGEWRIASRADAGTRVSVRVPTARRT